MSQNLSSAAVVIGALRVNTLFFSVSLEEFRMYNCALLNPLESTVTHFFFIFLPVTNFGKSSRKCDQNSF